MQVNPALCRAIIFPKAFDGEVFSPEAFLKLQDLPGGESVGFSVGAMHLLGSPDQAHSFGCRNAARSNEGFRERNKRDPDPETEHARYLGYYCLNCEQVRAVKLECYKVNVRWRFEHNELAHMQIELDPLDIDTSNKARKRDRQLARTLLSMLLNGPERFICMADDLQRENLETIRLPILTAAPSNGDDSLTH